MDDLFLIDNGYRCVRARKGARRDRTPRVQRSGSHRVYCTVEALGRWRHFDATAIFWLRAMKALTRIAVDVGCTVYPICPPSHRNLAEKTRTADASE